MLALWRSIGSWGVTPGMSTQRQRAVLLTNRMCLILILLCLLYAVLAFVLMRTSMSVPLAVLCCMLMVGVLILNKCGHINWGRIILTLLFPLAVIGIAIAHKLHAATIEEFTYYGSRIVLIIAVVIPMVIFSLQEPKKLYGGILIFFIYLLLYEPLHILFGVGYYQVGFSAPGYLYMNLLMLLLFVLQVTAFYYYKYLLEKAENGLWRGNRQLSALYNELGRQHDKILQQTEKLIESQQKLQEANLLIEQQKELLEAENLQLHQHLLEKNKILQASNRELHSRLDELEQFSYTISHNLRGPVASLLGLTNILKPEEQTAGNQQILHHIRTAALALDGVIRDLSQLLQMRDTKEASETINIEYLLANVLLALKQEIDQHEVLVYQKLDEKEVVAVKSYLYSILYNLISNAIKYRHPNRPCVVTIRLRQVKNGILLQVVDQGTGIDLEQHGANLFKMYKRFHASQGGRGLGLYLIKTQTESMGGFVEVDSKTGEGSTFNIWLPQ